jgi:uncharacterized phiE125 gp8 family phage protein
VTIFLQPPFWAESRSVHWAKQLVVAPSAAEPISVVMAKQILKMDRLQTYDDARIGFTISAARAFVENLIQRKLPPQTWDVWLDGLPGGSYGRWLDLPMLPVQAVLSLTTYDVNDSPSVMDPAGYLVDLASEPARIGLDASSGFWPLDLRPFRPAAVRLLVGYPAITQAVASITWAGNVATVTTAAPHGYATGAYVTIEGADQGEFNGAFDVTVTSATSFTFPLVAASEPAVTGAAITASVSSIPPPIVQAIALMIVHFDQNRSAVDVAVRADSTLPFGVRDLLEPYMLEFLA